MYPAAYGPSRSPADDELELREIVGVIRRNIWVVLGCVSVMVAAAVLYVLFKDPVYESSALIQIAGTPTPITAVQTVPVGDEVNTQIEVLGSQTLATEVVQDAALQLVMTDPTRASRQDFFAAIQVSPTADTATLHLVRQPDKRFLLTGGPAGTPRGPYAVGQTVQAAGATFTLRARIVDVPQVDLLVLTQNEALDQLQRGLKIVRPSPDADVIRVRLRSTDPKLSEATLTAMSREFLKWRQGILTADARSREKVLRQELDTIQGQLTSSEEQLRTYRESQKVVDPEAEASGDVARLIQLQATRADVGAEEGALSKMLAEATTSAALRKPTDPSPYTKLISFPTLLRSGTSNQLVQSLELAEDQRAALLDRRTMADPDVKNLTTRITDIEEQLRQSVVTYAAGLRQQETSLDSSIARFGTEINRVPRRQMEYARLDRKPKVLADLYATLNSQLKDAEVAQAAIDPTVQLVDSAVTAIKPVTPKPILDMAAAIILGLLMAMGVVAAREHLDPYVHTRTDVQRVTGVQVLGLIPHMRIARRRGHLRDRLAGGRRWAALRSGDLDELSRLDDDTDAVGVENGAAGSPVASSLANDPKGRAAITEAFARLQTNIQFLHPDREVKTVVFTSPLEGDGKTTSASNLALAIAQRGQRVLLIDADLRRGAVHSAFGVNRAPGLSSILRDGATFEQVAHVFELAGGAPVHVLTTGPLPPNPTALLASDELAQLVQRAEANYDAIIIDSPPINVVSDAAILGKLADGVVVVARAGVTAHEALAYAVEQLRMVRAPFVGAILNDVDFRRDAHYDGGYRYHGNPELYQADASEELAGQQS